MPRAASGTAQPIAGKNGRKPASDGNPGSGPVGDALRPGDKAIVSGVAAGPMSLANFELPNSIGNGSGSPRPSSRRGRQENAAERPETAGERPSAQTGQGRSGRAEAHDRSGGSRGTRGDKGQSEVEGGVVSSWGSSMFAPGSSIKGREEPKAGAGSRRERRQEEGVSGGSRVVRSESRGKEPKKGEECGDVEDEIDRVVGDVGDDPDDGRIKPEDDDDFRKWMEQDVDSLPDDRREKKPKAVRHDEESPGPKKDKKTRTPEEVDQKRGEIVDAYLERMVRELEKEVTADPKDFYDVKIFCRKPLKEANAALEVVFEKAWAKIDLEIRIAAIASLEQRCEAEVDELLRGPGGDWQRRAKEQAGAAIDSAGELQLRVAERLPPGRGGKSPLAEAEVTEEEIIRVAGLLPPEDPMHALLASASRDGVRAAPTAAGISQGGKQQPPLANLSTTMPIKPVMAHYAARQLR